MGFLRNQTMRMTFFLILMASASYINGECCGVYNLAFKAFPCGEFGGSEAHSFQMFNEQVAPTGVSNLCVINVCGDGKKHSGLFCGKGPCNRFGCNCDGGCINGDNVLENFKARTGLDASKSFSPIDPRTW